MDAKLEIAIQKYGHFATIHTLTTSKNKGMSTDQTIRIKQSLLTSTWQSQTLVYFFLEAFASLVQIYTFLLKSVYIVILLQLENIYTTYYFLYFILSKHHLFEV